MMSDAEREALIKHGNIQELKSFLDGFPSREEASAAILKDDEYEWNMIDMAGYERRKGMLQVLLQYAKPRFIVNDYEDDDEPVQSAFMMSYKVGMSDYSVEYLLLGYDLEELSYSM
jgi:hypothetical protein